ncbi:MAG: dihydroorotate dehydrogenase electron transfer subunit [candidate division KSB1 bacterium]|nr:dihydroorotate dehydrogenase electron transfer subunit [candidate division KSB1 bacterium]
MPALHSCPVVSNEQVTAQVFRLTVRAPRLATGAAPGQFVNVKVREGPVPLWRRPFSVYSVDRDAGLVGLLFAVRGTGTRLLAAATPGDTLDVLGPLGRAFAPPPEERQPLLVAGGLGVAPVHFLAQEMSAQGLHPMVLLGARDAAALCALDDLARLPVVLHLATEDGSRGFRGLVTELLVTLLADFQHSGVAVYACGPVGMLREVTRICTAKRVWGQICLETLMACGFGACMGCAVPTHATSAGPNYKLVCKDGPVFDVREIDLER